MISEAIRSKIKKIQIHTKRMMSTPLAGDYLSAFKGSGLEFDQLREYFPGDDIRSIDWNSSAKMNRLMVKQFVEERDRTIIICVDVSASTFYSSTEHLRSDIIAQVAGALTLIAQGNKDKVGVVFFSDHVESWIPPQRSALHIGRVLEKIFTVRPRKAQTNLGEVLRFLIDLRKRNAVVFMLSDWLVDEQQYSKLLKVVSVEYDFTAVRFLDRREQELGDFGFLEVEDPESGARLLLRTSGKSKDGHRLNTLLEARLLRQKKMFDKYRLDSLDLPLDETFFTHLTRFFHQRIKRQI